MSQSQPDSVETFIELQDKDGNVIDTIVVPAEEMALIEREAKAAGITVDEFINEIIAKLIERTKEEDVGS